MSFLQSKILGKYIFSYFGKLPEYGDFRRCNATIGEVKEFDNWLQLSILYEKKHHDTDWKQRFFNMPIYSFLFQPVNRQGIFCGVIKPSQDSVGRVYPFFIGMTILDRTRIQKFAPTLPWNLEPVYYLLYTLITQNKLIAEGPFEPVYNKIQGETELNIGPEGFRNNQLFHQDSLACEVVAQLFDEEPDTYNQAQRLAQFVNTFDAGKVSIRKTPVGCIKVVLPLKQNKLYKKVSMIIRILCAFTKTDPQLFSCFWTIDASANSILLHFYPNMLTRHDLAPLLGFQPKNNTVFTFDFIKHRPQKVSAHQGIQDFSSLSFSSFLESLEY